MGFRVVSPFTYAMRHRSRTGLMIGLVAFVTLGLYVMIALLNSMMDYTYVTKSFLTRFSLVYPTTASLDPNAVAQIRLQPEVDRVIPAKGVYLTVPGLIGHESFEIVGVPQDDLAYLLEVSDVELKDGRLLQPRTGEIMLSEEVAQALGLKLGDSLDRSPSSQSCCAVKDLQDLVLVGLLVGKPTAPPIRLGLASLEYLEGHEAYRAQPTGLLVVPRDERESDVETYLTGPALSSSLEVRTYGQIKALFDQYRAMSYMVFGVVDILVAVIIAFVIGIVNQIAISRRLDEFGLLHAIGYQKRWLTNWVGLATGTLSGVGWIMGLGVAGIVLYGLDAVIYRPRGMQLDITSLIPFYFVLPILGTIIAFTTWSVWKALAQIDPITIIERGQLSLESDSRKRRIRRSSIKPLSSWTFYQRHPRRAAILVSTMALMILGVAFPVFFLSPMMSARRTFATHLAQVSLVSPVSRQTLDPGVVATLKSQPTVARVIPIQEVGVGVSVPPISQTSLSIYGVSEDDLLYLLDLYGLTVTTGRLPQPSSNEVVVSQTLATNRGLGLGDKIGYPVSKLDSIPTEMVVVGILSPSDLWLGFAPLRFMQSHESYATLPVGALVVPKPGVKAEVDVWLNQIVPPNGASLLTYERQLSRIDTDWRGLLLVIAAVEGIIATVAAVALAVLNYIFFAQRRDELGILHALGYSRAWLTWRVARETSLIELTAWCIGAVVCFVSLFVAQWSLYAPKGLSVDFVDPGPWLFTLPIPALVLAVNLLTTSWSIEKLDTVSLIERK